MFVTVDNNFERYLQHSDPSQANFDRQVQHLSLKLDSSTEPVNKSTALELKTGSPSPLSHLVIGLVFDLRGLSGSEVVPGPP